MNVKPLTFTEFKQTLISVPSKSVRFRDMGSNKIEMLSLIDGSIISLGFIQLLETDLKE